LNDALRTRVKICGCTSIADVELAVDAGADAVGVILAESSPRRVSIERFRDIAQSVPAITTLVAVFVDPPEPLVAEALKVGAIPQFHGHEPADACDERGAGDAAAFQRFAKPYEHATWMFDTAAPSGLSGGTGRTFAWEIARRLAGDRRFVISGGLTPANVAECVRAVRPYAVDVRSGVETNGVKDSEKVHAFVRAVREADHAAQ
jgi:phosphoribosylanthranilate isomerase